MLSGVAISLGAVEEHLQMIIDDQLYINSIETRGKLKKVEQGRIVD